MHAHVCIFMYVYKAASEWCTSQCESRAPPPCGRQYTKIASAPPSVVLSDAWRAIRKKISPFLFTYGIFSAVHNKILLFMLIYLK